jgi:hypothetical protein
LIDVAIGLGWLLLRRWRKRLRWSVSNIVRNP